MNDTVIPFDQAFIDQYFNSHNDFMRQTKMHRSTFYSRIYGGWWVRISKEENGKVDFDLMQYKASFSITAKENNENMAMVDSN